MNTFGRTLGGLMSGLLLGGCFDGGHASSKDDRLQIVMMQPPRSGLTPLSDDAFKLSRWNTAETLVTLDSQGDAMPGLAIRWQPLDETHWRFELRDGVHFHDGAPLNADSVVHALNVAARATPKPRILDGVTLTAVADGDHAVIVTTLQADPLLPQRLSSPQLVILSPAAYRADGTLDPRRAGTGPFILNNIEGTSAAHLDRFDDYWGGKAQSAGIDVSFVPDGVARAAALRTHRADIVEAIPVSQVSLLPPQEVHEVPMPRTNTLYLNTRTGAFRDPALRALVAGVVQRQPIVERVYEGRADVAKGLLGPAIAWAAPLRDRQLPVEATVPAPANGKVITLATFSDRAELPEVAVMLAEQLKAAGFEVHQVVREYAHIESDALAGKFDAFILSRATVLDSGDPLAYLYSDFSCHGSFNLSQLCDAGIDQALQNAAGRAPGSARREAIITAERQILATHAAIPLLHERVLQGEREGTQGAFRDPRERQLIGLDTKSGSAP